MTKRRIQLSSLEKAWYSQVQELLGAEMPFWIVETGGKNGAGTNWWYGRLFQEVVDHFQGRVLFVHVGEPGQWNVPLQGVIDLRGQTDARQLVRLFYHAQGIVCLSPKLRHLAARVEVKPGQGAERPCMLVGSGRWDWTARVKERRAKAEVDASREASSSGAEAVIRQIHAWFARADRSFLASHEWRSVHMAMQRQQAGGLAFPQGAAMLERAFAVACDGAYFPGLRALLHSIAIYHGAEIPVFLYHRGLHQEQLEELRRLSLDTHLFELGQLPFPSPGMWEAKQQVFAHCLGRARCVQLLDADLVLVSAMDDVFELARAGKLVSSADGRAVAYDSRYAAYHPRLPGVTHPYINSGALCLDVVRHWDLAGLWAFASQYGAYTVGGGSPLGLPGHGDQGVLNAVAGLLGKTSLFHVLPEGTWCDSTRGCVLKIRRKGRKGSLVVWNRTERAAQRLVHSSGPKWWTPQGAAYLRRFGDKLRCFQHFAAWKPKGKRTGATPLARTGNRKARMLVGICSCAGAKARRAGIRATWLRCLPGEVTAAFFVGGGAATREKDVLRLAVQDNYPSLPQKVQAFFRRALEYCEFEYLFKCDDDTYVCVERLMGLAKAGADYVGGAEWVREGYASGGAGYLLSRRSVAVVAAARAPGCGPEDVWVGRVLREAGIKLHCTPRLRMDHRQWPSPENALISAHWCSPELMQTIEQGFPAPCHTKSV